jgi:CRISPR type III-A-associated RAMP protein Csm4
VGEEYFLPIPLSGFRIQIGDKKDDVKNRKKTGRLRYLSKALFEQGLTGNPIRLQENQISRDGSMASAQAWLPEKEFKRCTAQRVSVYSGEEGESAYDPEPFFLEQHFPGEGLGWYFLVQLQKPEDPTTRARLEACMKLLADEGLGIAKSRGMGHFTEQWKDFTVQTPGATMATHWLNLSLYCPAEGELTSEVVDQGAWSLMKRGGYIAVTDQVDAMRLRKKSIFMLAEGSVFPKRQLLTGKYVDLQPHNKTLWNPHPVYREGRPIFLPYSPST